MEKKCFESVIWITIVERDNPLSRKIIKLFFLNSKLEEDCFDYIRQREFNREDHGQQEPHNGAQYVVMTKYKSSQLNE